ncbi:MAG: hypothetical protein GY757_37890, partial [bacterium]|nr:hypothetical protein [bacterium]
IREVAESNEHNITGDLHKGFQQALELEHSLVEERINQSSLPISREVKTQLYQLMRGGILYYKHLYTNNNNKKK